LTASLLLINAAPGEIRAAWVEDGEVRDYRIEREARPSRVGDIHLGRVVQLLPALPAARVDIGGTSPAFLSQEDAIDLAPPEKRRQGIETYLHEGQSILVRIKRDAQDGKAIGLTARFEHTEPLLLAARQATAPALIAGGLSALERLLQDAGEIGEIRIDDAAALAQARAFFARNPQAQNPQTPSPALTLHPRSGDIFEDHGVAPELDHVTAREVPIEGGGRLLFDRCAAMSVIDVDSGTEPGRGTASKAALHLNLRAAAAIARQIRLRNLAGAIAIDFVSMRGHQDRAAVLKAFGEALASDPIPVRLLGWTRLGHVELTRRRDRPALDDILHERGPDGFQRERAMTIALACLRAAARAADTESPPGNGPVVIRAAPEIVHTLTGEAASYLDALATRLQRRLLPTPDPARSRGSFAVEPHAKDQHS